jgi:uncharacterized membrane protein YphA (DoxX/SURF4 family)
MDMDILILIGLLILGFLVNLIWEPGVKSANSLARAYLMWIAILVMAVWLFYFANIKNGIILKILDQLIHYGGYLANLSLGFLTGNMLFKLWLIDEMPNNVGLKSIVRTTLWGISLAIGNSFIVATAGKSMNMTYMIGFFEQSGYAIWFLYFIMLAEFAGGLGVLLHFKLRTGPLAAAGLMLIMVGAVYTHWHNNDPLSDSYAAAGEFINLSLILVLYYFEMKANPKPPVSTIYIV